MLATQFFGERMLDRERLFPCVFGVDAVRRSTLRYAFVAAGGDRVPELAEALRQFTSAAQELGRRTSLVCFLEYDPRLRSLDDCREHFWSLLQQVHDEDAAAWPADIPADTEDPHWEFSFNGTPMFVVANTPFHERRHSRYFEYLAITFQPRFVFDDLALGTPGGDNARNVIRARLDAYDDVERTPLLGGFGEPRNKEWLQYFLDDDNTPAEPGARCPMHVRSTVEEQR